MTDALACEAQTREFRTLSLAKRKTPRGHLVAHSLEQESGKGVVALPTVTQQSDEFWIPMGRVRTRLPREICLGPV